jgi:uncharacterized protein (TIGR01370 family)
MAGKNFAATKSRLSFNIKFSTRQTRIGCILFALLWAVTGWAAPSEKVLAPILRWSIQAHEDNAPVDPQAQMVILDPDHHPPFTSYPAGCLRIASLSAGEAEDRRSYWARISSAPYLMEQAKETEGNVRVDFRNVDWQRLLLQEEIPRALAAGFQGLMLDKLDSIPEDSREAFKNWLAYLRKTYPDLILLANGSDALETTAPYVNGYVTEDIFTTWDPASRRVRPTTAEERDERLDELGNALAAKNLPVYDLEEAESRTSELAQRTVKESKKHGFRPFLKIR